MTLTVTDDDLGVGSDVLTVTVGNSPPTVDAGPDQTVNLGDTVSINADFSDTGIGDTHTATIDWGDGSPVESAVVIESAGSGTVTGNHIYFWPGTYEVVVVVSDEQDEQSMGSDKLTVEVLPVVGIMIDTLSDDIDAMVDLSEATQTSLHASLDAAMKVLEDANPKNDVAAINALEAFINKIEAQRGKKISDGDAAVLIARVKDIIAALGGET